MAPSTSGLHHLAIVTSNLKRAEQFYAGVLGLAVLRRFEDDLGQPRSVWLDLGRSFLALERAGADGSTRAPEAPGLHCVALQIARADREAWAVHLERAGFPIEKQSPYTLYVRDPDGNLFALSHYPES